MSASPVHKLIQISDTHLRPGDPNTLPGWRAAARYIALAAPDCVIHTGDIVRDAPEAGHDHEFAVTEFSALKIPWAAVPGNHDVGDGPPVAPSPRPELIEAFRTIYGPDRWERVLGPWRLLGLNALLFRDDRLGPNDRKWSISPRAHSAVYATSSSWCRRVRLCRPNGHPPLRITFIGAGPESLHMIDLRSDVLGPLGAETLAALVAAAADQPGFVRNEDQHQERLECQLAEAFGFDAALFLPAPAGALVLGSEAFVDEAARVQKMFGALWRPVGILAAAASAAIASQGPRIEASHARAKIFASGLAAGLDGRAQVFPPETNIVMLTLSNTSLVEPFLAALAERDLRASSYGRGRVRFVFHAGISTCDAEASAACVREELEKLIEQAAETV